MPLLSDYARKQKAGFFFHRIPADAKILEIGSGSGWARTYFKEQHYSHYLSLDLFAPADIVGSILDWKTHGLQEASFDYIIAFEVIEHVPCLPIIHQLLKPGGQVFLTSPVPQMDWVMRLLEWMGLNQTRTSPHDYLTDFRGVPLFSKKEIFIRAGLAQWGIFTR